MYTGTSEYVPAADRWYVRANLPTAGNVSQELIYNYTGAAVNGRAYINGGSNVDPYNLLEYMPVAEEPIVDISASNLTALSSVAVGATVTIAAAVTNEGNRPASFTVDFSAGTVSLGFDAVIALAAGASRAVSATWSTVGSATGTYELRAVVAPLIDEVDTADNTATGSITLTATPMASLVGKSAWAEHRRYSIAGDEDAYQTLFAKVKNTAATPVTLRVQFTISKDGAPFTTLYTASKTLLFSGAGATITANLNAATAGVGSYNVVAQLQISMGGTWTDSGSARTFSFEINP